MMDVICGSRRKIKENVVKVDKSRFIQIVKSKKMNQIRLADYLHLSYKQLKDRISGKVMWKEDEINMLLSILQIDKEDFILCYPYVVAIGGIRNG